MSFGETIDCIVKNFPDDEKYNLVRQMKRAGDSIALNIAEGSIGQSNPEQIRFIGYAIRSLAEVVTCLHKAKKRKYVTIEIFDELYSESFHLMNMLNAYKSKLK